MTPRSSALLVLFALPLAGCARTGKGTFEDMKARACEADAPGFFEHVDKTQVGESLAKEAGVEAMDPSALQAAFTAWEDDIKKGQAGDLCKMQLVSVEELESASLVRWKSASGKDNLWRLQRYDKRWLLVETRGDEAHRRASAAAKTREDESEGVPEPPPPPDRRAECAALIRVINEEGAKLAIKGDPGDPAAIARLAESVDEAAKTIGAVRLTIPELIKYRDISAKLFQSTAGIARATSRAVRERDAAGVNAGLKAMAESADLNAKAVRGINKFCQAQP